MMDTEEYEKEFESLYMIRVRKLKFKQLFEKFKQELEAKKGMHLGVLVAPERYWIYNKIIREGDILEVVS